LVVQVIGTADNAARGSVTAVTAVTGLVIGSFLNVVVWRVPRGLSVLHPGSFCPGCGTPIRPWDNVPVMSWLVLRARCRHCGDPISARYPIVELSTGVLFGAVAWALGAHWAVPGMCVLGATTLALAAIELDGLAPPATVSLVGTGLGAVALAGAAVADRRWWHLGGMGIGIAVTGLVVVTTAWATRRRDDGVTLPWALMPAGAVMGWVGPLGAGIGVATSAVVLVGVSAIVRRRHESWHRGTGVAVASAIGGAAAFLGAFLAGNPIGR
jgi:prepilin signal peptidase PulO-like enzyme (type II secretory pathway)